MQAKFRELQVRSCLNFQTIRASALLQSCVVAFLLGVILTCGVVPLLFPLFPFSTDRASSSSTMPKETNEMQAPPLSLPPTLAVQSSQPTRAAMFIRVRRDGGELMILQQGWPI